MKHTLTFLAIILALSATAQSVATAKFTHTDSSGNYLIKYRYYRDGYCTIPLTYPQGEPHYPALISVFEICETDTVLLSKFAGTFTTGGCCMSSPMSVVSKAKLIGLEKEEPASVSNWPQLGYDVDGSIYTGYGTISTSPTVFSSTGTVSVADSDDGETVALSGPLNEPAFISQPISTFNLENRSVISIQVGEWFEVEGYPGLEFKLIERKKQRKR